MKRCACAVLLVLLGTLVSVTIAVAAQRGGWAVPVPVSDTQKTPSSWFPDLAIGPDGSVHIIWSSGLPGAKKEDPGRDLLLYRELRAGKWSTINDIDTTGKGGYTVRNSIIMGQDGKLHVLVRQGLVTTYLSAPWNTAWSAQAWSAPRQINSGGSYFNALAMDHKGALHILWNEAISDDPLAAKPACSFCADLFYRRSGDGGQTWSSPINLSQSPQGSVKQQIKIDQDDNVHVVWEEGFDWYASTGVPEAGVYRRSRDGGKSWGAPVRFTLPDVVPKPVAPAATAAATPAPTPAPLPDAPRQMTIGLYQNRAPLVVYRGNATDNIYYQASGDGGTTWSATSVIAGIRARDVTNTDHDDYAMATDGAGNVHLICTGYLAADAAQGSALKLLHLTWNGTNWSAPETIASDDTYPDLDKVTGVDGKRVPLYPEWPRAAISGDSLHITWFTRNKTDLFTSDRASYQVWYSVHQLDAPAIAPLQLFTPVPTAAPATPTAAPTAAPTPTLPPDVANAPPVDRAPTWEGPGTLALAFALLATIALLALAIGGYRLVAYQRQRPHR